MLLLLLLSDALMMRRRLLPPLLLLRLASICAAPAVLLGVGDPLYRSPRCKEHSGLFGGGGEVFQGRGARNHTKNLDFFATVPDTVALAVEGVSSPIYSNKSTRSKRGERRKNKGGAKSVGLGALRAIVVVVEAPPAVVRAGLSLTQKAGAAAGEAWSRLRGCRRRRGKGEGGGSNEGGGRWGACAASTLSLARCARAIATATHRALFLIPSLPFTTTQSNDKLKLEHTHKTQHTQEADRSFFLPPSTQDHASSSPPQTLDQPDPGPPETPRACQRRLSRYQSFGSLRA